MRRQLNTLYVTTEGAWLKKDGANVVMEVEGDERARLPIHMLEEHRRASDACWSRRRLLGFCAEQGVSVAYLSSNGRFLARVEGPVAGNVLLRREQYRVSDDLPRAAPIVQNIRRGQAVQPASRDQSRAAGPWRQAQRRGSPTSRTDADATDDHRAASAASKSDIDVLRGLEGEAAQSYFGVFGHLVRVDDPAAPVSGRSRRPPLDAINALLSFVSTHCYARLPVGARNSRARSGRRLSASRPAGASESRARSDRGVAAGHRGSSRALADQSQAVEQARLQDARQRRGD